ncbi:putative 3-beta hydroxysteroid dehydrogenase/isomerase [Paecilomyces variotii]|uniref:Putative 3-beta hydroxysteroid dehydrogenase/isomerase n=1 Tax=Byssochlamys spectabilis TaxID=264951 RepID=A0A443I7V7_BYSSP|nr:putative 3-beta hydroxysteroid dehydrogenase/isomerase [Paecilomyces variotii]RWR00076.1 putative 3-beta hydroxysteroid dehydrogenase/isomerase [Paecilomyces variotii]
MPSSLIFITGAIGFIGSVTTREAFVLMSDFTHESSFSGKLNGVYYVLHMASPIAAPGPDATNKETYFKPAANGTIAILKAAAKIPSINKVIVTSSILALVPMSGVPNGETLHDFSTAMNMYHPSKIVANNASWKFKKTASSAFLLSVHILDVAEAHIRTLDDKVANGSKYILTAGKHTWIDVVALLKK